MTMKTWVLDRSPLPKTGIHTMREHLKALVPVTVSGALGGKLELSVETSEIEVAPQTTELSVNNVPTSINVSETTNELEVGTNVVHIEIDC